MTEEAPTPSVLAIALVLFPASRSWVLGTPDLPPLRASEEIFPALPEVLPFCTRWSG